MWQEIAVICIGICTIGYVGRKLYRLLTRPGNDPCAGCNGCALKKEMGKQPRKTRSCSPIPKA